MKYREDEHGNLVLEDGTVIPKEKRQKAEVYSRVVGYGANAQLKSISD